MNFEMWIMYVSWNLPTSPVLSLSRVSSNVNTISAAETGISIASTPRSCRNFCHVLGLKIALILLLRHFWTLNFSSLKQQKGNNIYKLTQTWNSECSSYKYSTWHRTNVRTLLVCLQQKSSKVTWNYTWNLTLRRWDKSVADAQTVCICLETIEELKKWKFQIWSSTNDICRLIYNILSVQGSSRKR